MTDDELIKLAREATGARIADYFSMNVSELKRFAELVAAAEREACAKVCESFKGPHRADVFNAELSRCADAIRARGKPVDIDALEKRVTMETIAAGHKPILVSPHDVLALVQQLRESQARVADLEAAGHKTAMELECLLLDCKDTAVVSKWFDTGMAALSAWQELFEYQGPRLGD